MGNLDLKTQTFDPNTRVLLISRHCSFVNHQERSIPRQIPPLELRDPEDTEDTFYLDDQWVPLTD